MLTAMAEKAKLAKKPSRESSEGKPTKRGGFKAWLTRRHDPLTSLLLTIPVFLLYHLGIVPISMRNGVDLVSGLTFRLLDESLLAYVGVTVGYAAAIGVAVAVLRKKNKIHPAEWLPVLGESAVLAVVMSLSVGWATNRLFDWQTGAHGMSAFEKLVMAAGAGFHEELIFRVCLFAGGAFLLARFTKLGETKSALLSALVSSLVFSAIHYVGPFGDPFTLVSFTFRVLAGLYLAAVYRFRGFAVAVYTHFIYDVIVFFV
jgi:membrane protease YdiL (CAAX protease family)